MKIKEKMRWVVKVLIENNNQKYLKKLKKYAPFIEEILRYLSQSYKFRLPKEVILMDMKKPRAKSNNN